ncbi:MAG: 30S ribosomal protein S20, partial [Proteobacteria bacterium]|nr:30S ribosomal protein S20 [Pseudomonadota bacterium]
SRISRVRTYIKYVEVAIANADKDAAQAALKAAQPEIMRSVNKGLIHRNKASRKISRLAARVNAI